jgi:hypothetical protein
MDKIVEGRGRVAVVGDRVVIGHDRIVTTCDRIVTGKEIMEVMGYAHPNCAYRLKRRILRAVGRQGGKYLFRSELEDYLRGLGLGQKKIP